MQRGNSVKGKLNFAKLSGGILARNKQTPFSINRISGVENFEVKEGKRFCYSGLLNNQSCIFKLDTGSDVSIVNEKFVTEAEGRVLIKDCYLKYPTGEIVPVKYKIEAEICLGKIVLRMPIFVAEIFDECLLGVDFLSKVGVCDNLFYEIFENFKKKDEVSSRNVESSGKVSDLVEDIFKRFSGNLSLSQKEEYLKFLSNFQEVFSKEIVAGNCNLVEHSIKLRESCPIKQVPRRIPFHLRSEVDQIIEDMKCRNIIEESCSPWVSPAVMVKKKDGSLRFCVDYRKLNAVTIKDSYPLPRIDEIIDRLAGNVWFSILDLKSGYWQIRMSPEDKEKTAFSIGNGLWQFNVLPFGLCNAPATFERLMEKVLGKLLSKICFVYLDDVIVFGKTFEKMLLNLKEVFNCFKKANLKVNPEKCNFFSKEVTYLGFRISEKGVSTDPAKISSVTDWPVPKTKKQLRSFLGFCSYYRKFIKGFSLIAKPLFVLTEDLSKFVWDMNCQEVFEKLKKLLVSAPILSFPIEKGEFILDTDASGHGIGAVLSQIQGGSEKVIAYFSRVLNKSERNYCVTRRELLAIVDSIRSFHQYLYGQKFVVRTDHASLRWLLSFKDLEGQLARWLERLQQYDFEPIYRSGVSHGNADGLSRRPCQNFFCKYCERVDERNAIVKEQLISRIVLENSNLEEWSASQKKDQIISLFFQKKCEGKRPLWQEISSLESSAKIYYNIWDSLEIKDNVLFRKWISPNFKLEVFQIVVPQSKVCEILKEAHDSPIGGHFGINKTLEKVRKRFYWASCKADVEIWCKSCEVCLARKGPSDKGKSPFQIYNVGIPFERIQMDILGPLPLSNKGNRFLLVIVDCFSKWPEAFPLKNIRAKSIAQVFVSQIISRFGVPLELHTDQGRSFESRLLIELSHLLGIKKTRTTPLHPQSDGQVERQHQTILDYLSKFVAENQKDWDEWIPMFLLAYRSSKHESTGISPSEVIFGKDIYLPLDLIRGVPSITKKKDPQGYFCELKENLSKVHSFVRENLEKKSSSIKCRYDRKVRKINFVEKQKVWLYNPKRFLGKAPKLQRNWEGPYEIVRKINDVVFCIRKSPKHRNKIVHSDRLASFCEQGNEIRKE